MSTGPQPAGDDVTAAVSQGGNQREASNTLYLPNPTVRRRMNERYPNSMSTSVAELSYNATQRVDRSLTVMLLCIALSNILVQLA